MTIAETSYTWEHRLLAMAYEAFGSAAASSHVRTDDEALDDAYAYCARVTQTNSRTFYLAARLLPPEKQRAVHALYAFCRATDDLVDTHHHVADMDEVFSTWRKRLAVHHPTAHDPVPLAWAETQSRFGIPQGYAEQLIDGIARDRVQRRYASFADLSEYCYSVASTVGLMVMHIVSFQDETALPYAVKLGVALQMTNILRDVGEDWRMGRLYLPLDELAAFGLSERDIAAGRVTDQWRAFMRFQIDRARTLYKEAEPGIQLLDSDGRFAIAAAAGLYRAILDDIEQHDYDVFHRRAHISWIEKLKRLPGIWWTTRGNN